MPGFNKFRLPDASAANREKQTELDAIMAKYEGKVYADSEEFKKDAAQFISELKAVYKDIDPIYRTEELQFLLNDDNEMDFSVEKNSILNLQQGYMILSKMSPGKKKPAEGEVSLKAEYNAKNEQALTLLDENYSSAYDFFSKSLFATKESTDNTNFLTKKNADKVHAEQVVANELLKKEMAAIPHQDPIDINTKLTPDDVRYLYLKQAQMPIEMELKYGCSANNLPDSFEYEMMIMSGTWFNGIPEYEGDPVAFEPAAEAYADLPLHLLAIQAGEAFVQQKDYKIANQAGLMTPERDREARKNLLDCLDKFEALLNKVKENTNNKELAQKHEVYFNGALDLTGDRGQINDMIPICRYKKELIRNGWPIEDLDRVAAMAACAERAKKNPSYETDKNLQDFVSAVDNLIKPVDPDPAKRIELMQAVSDNYDKIKEIKWIASNRDIAKGLGASFKKAMDGPKAVLFSKALNSRLEDFKVLRETRDVVASHTPISFFNSKEYNKMMGSFDRFFKAFDSVTGTCFTASDNDKYLGSGQFKKTGDFMTAYSLLNADAQKYIDAKALQKGGGIEKHYTKQGEQRLAFAQTIVDMKFEDVLEGVMKGRDPNTKLFEEEFGTLEDELFGKPDTNRVKAKVDDLKDAPRNAKDELGDKVAQMKAKRAAVLNGNQPAKGR